MEYFYCCITLIVYLLSWFHKYITTQMRIFTLPWGVEWVCLANVTLSFESQIWTLPYPSLQTPLAVHTDPLTHIRTVRFTQRHRLNSWIQISVTFKMNWNCIDMLTNKYVQLMRFYLNSSYIPQLGKWHPLSPSTQTLGQKLGSDPGSLSFSLPHLIAHPSLSSSPWSLLSTTKVAALM